MVPPDALAPPATRGTRDAGSSAHHRSRLRGPAMVLPYLGILVGVVMLARLPESRLQGFWWLAPTAVIAYVIGLSLALGSLVRRRRKAQHDRDSGGALEAALVSSLALTEPGRRAALELLLPWLRDIRVVSDRLSDSERGVLRVTLAEIGASATVEAELARARRKWRRAQALFTLGWLADERSIPALRDALNGPDPDLAYVAGQSLADYDSARACGCLIDALRTDAIPRPLAATLLEGSRYAGAADLIAEACGDPDPDVRSWVAYLLGRSHDPRADTWLSLLAGDPEAMVRASAVEALGGFSNPETLRRRLADDDCLVRASAARSVGRAGLSELAAGLVPLLHDRVWGVRQSATLALKDLGGSSVAVVRPLLEDEDRFVRNKAAEVLVEVGYVAAQIAALAGTESEVADARRSLTAVARAEAGSSIAAGAAVADAATRERVRELLQDVDAREVEAREVEAREVEAREVDAREVDARP